MTLKEMLKKNDIKAIQELLRIIESDNWEKKFIESVNGIEENEIETLIVMMAILIRQLIDLIKLEAINAQNKHQEEIKKV